MASLVAPLFEDKTALVVRALTQAFPRVAVFEVSGTQACLVSAYGIARPPYGIELSLRDATPLRFALEAASPIVGAGRGPGGDIIATTLGMSVPRAYTTIPVVDDGRLSALVYADADADALPLAVVSEAFALCHRTLVSEPTPLLITSRRDRPSTRKPKLVRTRRLSTLLPPEAVAPATETNERAAPLSASAPATPEAAAQSAADGSPAAGFETASPTPEPAALPAPTSTPPSERVTPLRPPLATVAPPAAPARLDTPAPRPRSASPAALANPPPLRRATRRTAPAPAANDDTLVVTPRGVVRTTATRRPAFLPWLLGTTAVAAVLALGLFGVSLMAPPSEHEQTLTLTIPPKSSIHDIARALEAQQVVKSGAAFTWLARVLDLDRTLRAGTYQLPQSAWAWEVVRELARGQVHSVRITVPEGLTLKEIAALFEHHGLTSADELILAARDKDLLEKYELGGTSAEGYLFPETYTFARGLSAKEMVDAMVEQFFERIARIPEAVRASPEALRERVILASIIEKEARDESEQPRIAGVFQNRLDRAMKLESCATVLYVLGAPKDRLTLNDVRTPSPYNTYLNHGLPPGPIASPGFGAIRAAFRPEKHDYLFFFAKDDGSYQHVFTKTYAEHQKEQQKLSRR